MWHSSFSRLIFIFNYVRVSVSLTLFMSLSMSVSVSQFLPTPCTPARTPDSHGLRGADWAQFMALRPVRMKHKGAGEMAQWSRAMISLPDVLSSIPSNHIVAHNHL